MLKILNRFKYWLRGDPEGWTSRDEVEYQNYMTNLKVKIAKAPNAETLAVLNAMQTGLSGPSGRVFYQELKRKDQL